MIAIIDYGAGNTASVANALERLGAGFTVTADTGILLQADAIILPGVGAAAFAMANLNESGIAPFLLQTRKPVLGICLGMQMLTSFSEEGNTACLGIIDARCEKFSDQARLVPHMGWTTVELTSQSVLFEGIADRTFFYFAHSFKIPQNPAEVARAENGQCFSAALEKDNFFGVQFHPEKSGEAGSRLLTNFINLNSERSCI